MGMASGESLLDPRFPTLVAQARAGDPGALATLRAHLAETPGLFRQIGEMAAVVRQSWLDVIAGQDPAAWLERRATRLERRFQQSVAALAAWRRPDDRRHRNQQLGGIPRARPRNRSVPAPGRVGRPGLSFPERSRP
jgi:hypothetical protein